MNSEWTYIRQMNGKKKIAVIVGLALLIGVSAGLYYAFSGANTSKNPVKKNVVQDRKKKKDKKARGPGFGGQRLAASKPGEARRPPKFTDPNLVEEAKLSAQYKKLLADLQAAFDAEDHKKIISIVRHMQKADEWPDGIPSVLHKAAIDSLKWFGSKCAPELIAYLGSADKEVVEEARGALLETLSDPDISDYERSTLLLNYSKVVMDPDTLDTMMMELDNMRPTVRAETAQAILSGRNETAIGILKENLDFFFTLDSGEEVKDASGIKKYLEQVEKEYAEDPEKRADDEEFYGGDKSAAKKS